MTSFRMHRCGTRLLAAIAIVFCLGTGASAQGVPVWDVDPEQSEITFVGRQMGVPSEGKFRNFSGTIRFAPDAMGASELEFTVELTSAETGNSDIDAALMTPKWFDAEEHPQATFIVSSFRETGEMTYEAVGEMTIKGVSQEVVVPFRVETGPGDGGSAPETARATGEFSISRLAYDIGDDEWRDTSIVADEVVIRFDILAIRRD